jgi:hypothetical protein
MGRLGIGHSNLTDNSTLSGGSWNASFPLTRLQQWSLNSYAVATSNSAAHTIIDWDHGSAKTAGLLWIPYHNLTSAATIEIERGTSSGGTEVYDGGALAAWPFAPLDGDYDGGSFGLCLVWTENSARYTRLRIVDTSNPSPPQLSRPFLGRLFTSWIDPEKLEDDWMPSLSIVRRTEIGADWRHKRRPLRQQSLVWKGVTEAEGSTLKEIVRLHDTSSEVVYVADTVDRAVQQQDGFLGLFREMSKLEYPFWKHRGMALSIQQRGGAPGSS